MIPWLTDRPAFPPVERALTEPNGLLAAGGRLTPEWLLAAYRRGIFPWYSDGEPILWWSPDPRLVLQPAQIRITRSLRKVLRGRRFEVRFDTAFARVIEECAAPREPGGGTWITPEIRAAYLRMHELGYAHSVESWLDGRLVGGLYGMALGRAFFGESMFSRVSDASKVALAHLARFLEQRDFGVIDCQMTTPHLLSMGAHEIARREFCAGLERWTVEGPPPAKWSGTTAAEFDWN
ncbi:leucyl/phenylalanyl-tRNA--protein transferase [Azoarcus olearius]|uniref:Leucyl/phenylalanyl-tRNA--protein transferase n=1 Tax=Azoarcus sp. (strain BH72) TaxID=418699 RepID=LFTR_AZOSB|nr:leucyl/phenylalanyl-tRNA--protein transferase [Azoarcus olearius]A1K7M0.1 RecName: Full=Leucyl/phenylalanyl-tRNA--protein transferase; AltName: Full=L/F-transferase; AltName: Full=Leucyltransferase; AltName: Full=Phenyalanyltransferase [Azoarcus olearius]CAL94825.1 probable leucyl/phenylalanyl-tRNA--protein transferase [Azoarcus olearius]